MNTLINWLARKSLKRRKQRLLVEVLTDIRFIEQFRRHYLEADEASLRKQLEVESKKEKRDQELIDSLADRIANSSSIRAEYEQLKERAKELPHYIALL